jgi:hypothetical protein
MHTHRLLYLLENGELCTSVFEKVAGSFSDEVIGFFNWPWGQFSLKGRPARGADNLTAICEPIVYNMWEPQRLTTLRAFMACYRDSFTFMMRQGHLKNAIYQTLRVTT